MADAETKTLRIALLQLLPDNSTESNLAKGIAACRSAKDQGADIALFPEMWSSGYKIPEDFNELHTLAINGHPRCMVRSQTLILRTGSRR